MTRSIWLCIALLAGCSTPSGVPSTRDAGEDAGAESGADAGSRSRPDAGPRISCTATTDCPSGARCEAGYERCPDGSAVVRDGGECVQPLCRGRSCLGAPCWTDDDCDLDFSCHASELHPAAPLDGEEGVCQSARECGVLPLCDIDAGCVAVDQHGDNCLVCACPSCGP